jgi:Fe2+ transport system protein FeoA
LKTIIIIFFDSMAGIAMQHTLWDMNAGDTAELAGWSDALPQVYETRLLELGFRPGATVACVQRPRFGAPRIFRVGNAVFSLEDTIGCAVLIRQEEAL